MKSRPRGFTLVEILVVVVIIAILIAILLPAIYAAVATANNARVSAEEQNLQTALASFKNQYGESPPSRIILVNNGDYSPTSKLVDATGASINPTAAVAAGDQTYVDIFQRTARAMRKYFPRASGYFSLQGPGAAHAWAPAGGKANFVILQGDECLVFFLGGMPLATPQGITPSGFARDPANPFTVPNLAAVKSSRSLPLYEFPPSRIVDIDGDGYPSFVDPLSANGSPSDYRPYAYFSAYGNNGYDPNDCNFAEADDSGNAVSRAFVVNFVVSGGGRVAQSASPNPYCLGDADPANPTSPSVWHNNLTHQLISAGRDGLWGPGGPYDPSSSSTHLPVGFANDPANAANTRKYERDNVTNFSAGKLD